MFKFVIGPITGLISGLSLWETVIFTTAGMMTSVIIFSFIGERLRNRLLKKYYKPRRGKWAVAISRWLEKHGVQGIAFITPVILSPIIGTLLASSVRGTKKKLIFSMLVSAVFWAITINVILFKIRQRIY
jgi:hypothetical protein